MEKKMVLFILYIIVTILFIILSIIDIVFSIYMYKYTKNGNPLDMSLNDDRRIYFNNANIFNQFFFNSKRCECGNEILNDFCTEEQILAGCKDISASLNKKSFLRSLGQGNECNEYGNKLKDIKNKNLSDVFSNLKFGKIHGVVLGMIIMLFYGIVIEVPILVFAVDCGSGCFAIGKVVYFILFICFLIYYSQSKISNFLDFLDCKNVKASIFNLALSDSENIEKFGSSCLSFDILNFFYIYLSFVLMYFYDERIKEKRERNN